MGGAGREEAEKDEEEEEEYGGTEGGRKTRTITMPRRISSCCRHFILPVSTCCLY